MSSTTLSIIHADLSIEILNKLIKNESSSIIFSPLSLIIAFSMAYSGSSGSTKEQIKKYLLKECDDEELHKYLNEFLNDSVNDKKRCLQSVNKVYVKEGFSLLDSFTHVINKYYYGQFEQIDFLSPNACNTINDFVQKSTNDNIKNLITSGDLDDKTRLILINALHFKNQWAMKFDKYVTKEKDFYVSENDTRKVDMMYEYNRYNYYENDEYQIVQIFYEDYRQSMVIFLPKEKYTLSKRISSMDGKKLFDMLDLLTLKEVKLYLPKFKTESKHLLREVFVNIGMTIPFSKNADFSLMTKEESLKIDKIIQKTFVEVNEDGTEASAATAVVMSNESCRYFMAPKEYVFNANHPFMYLIIDDKRNILFNGIYQ